MPYRLAIPQNIPFHLRYFIKNFRFLQVFYYIFFVFFGISPKKPFISIFSTFHADYNKFMKRQILGKNVYENGQIKGIVQSVCLAKKYPYVKQLNCKLLSGQDVCISALKMQTDSKGVHFERLRASIPGDYTTLSKNTPIYDEKGTFLTTLSNVEIVNGLLISFVGQNSIRYPYASVKAISDAIILGKKSAFPLGEPLPACHKTKNGSPFVCKSALQKALKKGELIKFTLSLEPFDFSL